jgi:hypothetical protein
MEVTGFSTVPRACAMELLDLLVLLDLDLDDDHARFKLEHLC